MDIAQRVQRWPNTQELLTCGCPPSTCVIPPKTIAPLDSMPWWPADHPITESLPHLRDCLKSIFYLPPPFLLWLARNFSGSHVESVSKTLQTHHFFATTVPHHLSPGPLNGLPRCRPCPPPIYSRHSSQKFNFYFYKTNTQT